MANLPLNKYSLTWQQPRSTWSGKYHLVRGLNDKPLCDSRHAFDFRFPTEHLTVFTGGDLVIDGTHDHACKRCLNIYNNYLASDLYRGPLPVEPGQLAIPDYKDHFAPPQRPVDVVCLHCGQTHSSADIWFDHYETVWRCPTVDCSGMGFGFDLHPAKEMAHANRSTH